MQEQVTDKLLRVAQDCDDITQANHDVLVGGEDEDILLPDGTKTPSLSKRVKQFGGQVTSVAGLVGDITAQDITNELELGTAAQYDAIDLMQSKNLKDESGLSQQEINNDIKKIAYANFPDVRNWGVIPNQTTDYTALIRDIVQNQLGSHNGLYIPEGVRWDYTGIYNYLNDYQKIIDESGRDEARNLWQSTRITWHKTNANTGATNGNTETVAGDYHPAYVVDTYGAFGTTAARASTVYRLGGSSKWQIGMDATTTASHFSIAQYGSFVDGTKSFAIGHQDGTVAGKFGFSHALATSSMLYNFGKASYLDEATPFTVQYLQSSVSTASFQKYYRYGTTTAYREDIKPDGTHEVISKNSRRITTTANCVRFGTRLNIKSLTASALLNVDESTSYITNINATVSITASLPKAVTGLVYEFSVDAAYGLRVQPNASDNFIDKAIGKYKESTVVGSKLRVVAVSDNTWSYEQAGTWTDQA